MDNNNLFSVYKDLWGRKWFKVLTIACLIVWCVVVFIVDNPYINLIASGILMVVLYLGFAYFFGQDNSHID